MSLDKIRAASIFIFIVLIEMAIIGAMATAQKDRDSNGLENASGQIVKIGAIYNLEGSQSPLDLPSSRGAMLAVQEINARGGIDGREIELILCDGKSDSAVVRQCAEGLVAKKVSAMIGLSDTDMVLAAAPVATGAGIPFVTSGATSPKLAEEYDGLFLACFGDNVQAEAGAEYAYNEMGLKTCSLLVDGNMEYARLLSGYFKERYLELGGKIIKEAFVNDSNLKSLSRVVADENPDMIYLAAGPEEARAMIEVMRNAGIASPIFGGDSLDSSELRRKGMGRIVFSTHALLDDNSSSTGEFVKTYRAKYGFPPENSFSALGYDTVKLLAKAIDRADSDNSKAIFRALENTTGFKGITGEISYSNGHIPNKGVTMILLSDGEITGSKIVIPENETSIRFVFDRDFAPFTYVENGSVYGFELDLLRILGKEEGFLIILDPLIWTQAKLSFQKGDADVIGGLVKTAERQKQYNFTIHPHGTFDILTFVLDDSDIRSTTMLKGRKVAAQNGSISLDLLKNQAGVQVQAYDSENEGLQALLQGKADAFVGGGLTTWFRIRQQNITGIRALAMPWEMHSLYFGVRDPVLLQSLDRGLEKLMQDGRYDQLYRRWFVQELNDSEIQALVNASRQASLNAYAPYSRYAVGAAVLTTSGKIYSGSNVENALYGLSTSALKVAVFKAISEGDGNIRAVVNYLPDGRAAAPTGDERQILFEFGRCILVILGVERNYTTKMVSEIFPYPFEMRG